MKKIRAALVAAALASLALVTMPTTAEGHGTCSVVGGQIQVTSTPSVTVTGGYDCFGTNHGISVTLRIQRRTPGQSWNTIASKVLPAGVNVDRVTGFLESSGYNCAKDYRSQITGGASPGGHSQTKNGTVKSHTC